MLFILGGVIVIAVAIYEIVSGQLVSRAKYGRGAYRDSEPLKFWGMIAFQAVLAMVFILHGLDVF